MPVLQIQMSATSTKIPIAIESGVLTRHRLSRVGLPQLSAAQSLQRCFQSDQPNVLLRACLEQHFIRAELSALNLLTSPEYAFVLDIAHTSIPTNRLGAAESLSRRVSINAGTRMFNLIHSAHWHVILDHVSSHPRKARLIRHIISQAGTNQVTAFWKSGPSRSRAPSLAGRLRHAPKAFWTLLPCSKGIQEHSLSPLESDDSHLGSIPLLIRHWFRNAILSRSFHSCPWSGSTPSC